MGSFPRLVAASLAGLWLTGCAFTPRGIRGDAAPSIKDTDALLIASVTMGHSGRFFSRVGFFFELDGGIRRFRLDSAVPRTIQPMLESTPDDGLEAMNGRLYAFVVPAGTYVLDQIVIFEDSRVARPEEPMSVTVEGGTAVYLGNLFVTLCHLWEPSGHPYYVAGGTAGVVDRSDRDYALLFEKLPGLRGMTIEKRVIDGGEVGRVYADLGRKCPD